MPIEVEKREPDQPLTIHRVRKMVPVRVTEIRKMVAGGDTVREKHVRETTLIGDVCVIFHDEATHCDRILSCRRGVLLTTYFADYLLFEYDPTVARVVIAKPEN